MSKYSSSSDLRQFLSHPIDVINYLIAERRFQMISSYPQGDANPATLRTAGVCGCPHQLF